jgi:hypothetical protein
MTVYRRIVPQDVPRVTDLALRALASSGEYPLHPSRPKVERMVGHFAVDRASFGMAAFTEDNLPVAAIALYVLESPFYERHEGHVVMCWSEDPGTGMRLIRQMMDWVKADIRVRRVIWAMNESDGVHSVAHRFGELVKRRFGFRSSHDNLVYYKGT